LGGFEKTDGHRWDRRGLGKREVEARIPRNTTVTTSEKREPRRTLKVITNTRGATDLPERNTARRDLKFVAQGRAAESRGDSNLFHGLKGEKAKGRSLGEGCGSRIAGC